MKLKGEAGEAPICDYYQERCVNRALAEYLELKGEGKKTCKCPYVCNDTIYTHFISTSKFSHFGGMNIIKLLNLNSTYEEFCHNFASVKLYLNQMEYTKITTIPAYRGMSLLADLGGALSLMLGATILTIVQVIEMTFNVCFFKLKEINSKKSLTENIFDGI